MGTIEQSHDKARLTQPRLSDVGTVPIGDERSKNHTASGTFAPGNRAAANRSAKVALTRPLRAARRRLQAAGDALGRPVADELLSDAMAVYGSARLELGSRSVFVLAHLVTFSTEQVLGGYYTKLGAERGFDTEEGRAFVDMAHTCQTQAARAMTAALAALKALPKPDKSRSLADTIDAEADALEDDDGR